VITDEQYMQRRMDLMEQMRSDERYKQPKKGEGWWMFWAGLLCVVAGTVVGYLCGAGVCA
jgi:hypothetical protein